VYNVSTEFDVSKHGRYPSPDAKPQWNVATGTQKKKTRAARTAGWTSA